MKPKFPDSAKPTQIAYVDGRPKELHLRKCKFIWETNGAKNERIFEKSEISLGAMEDNDLVVNHDTVSRYHGKVVQTAEGYLLVDLESTNGTFINRVRIREAYLKPGCTIQLGQSELKFYFADEKVPIVPSGQDRLGKMIGGNLKMREIYGIVEKIAPTGATVVVQGETGTGKEVVAETIHRLSKRSGELVVFDCSAVPENLIESELFGHEKGSFTGAITTRQGRFELAHRGTLFLDELGELSLELQPKLLRALEQREVRRVGSNHPIKVDVRVIAATNRNLFEEVKGGRFREDLYYRLSVVPIYLPPLRDRPEDIPLLIHHFLQTLPFNRNSDGSLKVESVAEDAMELLARHRWSGNVRELLNVVERSVSFTDGKVMALEQLPESLRIGGDEASMIIAAEGTFKDAKERWVTSFERNYILGLLKRNNGNISHAAREADIDRKYFRKLMRKYEIDASELGISDDDDND